MEAVMRRGERFADTFDRSVSSSCEQTATEKLLHALLGVILAAVSPDQDTWRSFCADCAICFHKKSFLSFGVEILKVLII